VDKYALESVRTTTYNARPGCGVIETTADISIHWDRMLKSGDSAQNCIVNVMASYGAP